MRGPFPSRDRFANEPGGAWRQGGSKLPQAPKTNWYLLRTRAAEEERARGPSKSFGGRCAATLLKVNI
jgi:hypothetical protein